MAKLHLTAIVVFMLLIVLLALTLHRMGQPSENPSVREPNVRQPNVAGQFYPAGEAQLSAEVEGFLDKAQVLEHEGELKALIVPHAGYVYSGQVAADGFAQIQHDYNLVVVMASNHNADAMFSGISADNSTALRTPLGDYPVSDEVVELYANPLFSYVPAAHLTHVIEVEIPFLQEKLPDGEVIPLVTGYMTAEMIAQAADALEDLDALFVVSSDLSHYHPYDTAVAKDTSCLDAIVAMDVPALGASEMCGLHAALILMELAKRKGWQPVLVDYANSGDTAGGKDSVVGYGAVAFYANAYTDEEKRFLLTLARETIQDVLANGSEPDVGEVPGRLKEKMGCFVTLNENGALRGCIGHIVAQVPLYQCVIQNAKSAALNDARFTPVTYGEVPDLVIDVSILTTPEEVQYDDYADLVSKIVPGKDGIVLRWGPYQATYLPSVWDQLPTTDLFLSNLCGKAGLEADCVGRRHPTVLRYYTIEFAEGDV